MKLLAAPDIVETLAAGLASVGRLDIVSQQLSIFGAAALLGGRSLDLRLLVEASVADGEAIVGAADDRRRRGSLRGRSLARSLLTQFSPGSIRHSRAPVSQSLILHRPIGGKESAVVGSCSLTTGGLGFAAPETLGFVQAAESAAEIDWLAAWFEQHWAAGSNDHEANAVQSALSRIGADHAPATVYNRTLQRLFTDMATTEGPTEIAQDATGLRDTAIWSKLYRFQRDGVIGAIDKLLRLGGCIIADSVGLGKTLEALAVIKYFELRNDRVLVLAPKRLRENWTLWRANDVRNGLAADRLAYDVLNHTDLSRDRGVSGEIDLEHVNLGNYGLVVIDESHNFRNRPTGSKGDSRYDRLMEKVMKAGVRTRVLMLSATPVNNRLNDIKNQISFATEGDDRALAGYGIPSIAGTIRIAQSQFNRWQALPDERRTSQRLLEMLGFDYVRLLDLVTIARSRRHIEKYYGTAETGTFPDKLPPRNIKADTDLQGAFPPIATINSEIRRLSLAAYTPLRYVLPGRREAYEARYNQNVGDSVFRQLDREESLVALMRINLLKRMESSVHAFALTIARQLETVDALIARIDAHDEGIDSPDIGDLADDDPMFEELGVGRTVRVLLHDADLVKWRQDLAEDRARLARLLDQARDVTPDRDAKLAELKRLIAEKRANPINPGNVKLLVFTAFADTADYLYQAVKNGARGALVTGSGGANRTTVPGLRTDLASILSAFAPQARGRPETLAAEPELDLIIATDCISEGQNLQDCDTVVNYDIHWNPVRIVQRFGRVDRLGSPNPRIQLVNFWPNVDLDAYIGLERSVSGKMKLLDVSATGEENIIEAESGDRMNDLEYRRRQLEALQSRAVDLEDLSSGVSITDMTLNDLRLDLAQLGEDEREEISKIPLGIYAPVPSSDDLPPGALFVLRAETPAALAAIDDGDPLKPHALIYVGADESVILPPSAPKRALDLLRLAAATTPEQSAAAWARFDKQTKGGDRMERWQRLLAAALAAVSGKAEERAVDALFLRGGAGVAGGGDLDDWEVVAWLPVIESA